MKRRKKKPPILRFFNKVNTHNKDYLVCWEWTGANDGQKGYGVFWLYGERIKAHRASYILHCGEIPKDKIISQSCDNPCCVNPYHLSATTRSENLKDAVRKGRMSPPRLSGHKNGNSKRVIKEI